VREDIRVCNEIVLDKGSSQNDKDRAERLLLSARKFDVIRLSIILSFLLIFVVGMPLLWRWSPVNVDSPQIQPPPPFPMRLPDPWPSPKCFTYEELRTRAARLGREAPWLERLRGVDMCMDSVFCKGAREAACLKEDVLRAVALCMYGHHAAFEFA